MIKLKGFIIASFIIIGFTIGYVYQCGDGTMFCYTDNDKDGYISKECSGGNDCDDNNPEVNPAMTENCNDNIDNDCDGLVDERDIEDCRCVDLDQDGYWGAPCGVDCDDRNDQIYPNNTENCNDNIDNDCDGLVDSQDPECIGCRSTGNETLVNNNCSDSIDNDCDGLVDSQDPECQATTGCNPPCTGGRVCRNGQCLCPEGYSDCGNGCTNVLIDSQNCGQCGRRCNGDQVCQNGQCITQCSGGLTNCNGSCVNLNNDVNNCGSCNHRCDLPHAVESCQNGQCVISSCEGSWRDCDGNPSNGCEIDLNSDINNCGQCGRRCSSNQQCQNGNCVSTCGGLNQPCCSGSSCNQGLLCRPSTNTCLDPNEYCRLLYYQGTGPWSTCYNNNILIDCIGTYEFKTCNNGCRAVTLGYHDYCNGECGGNGLPCCYNGSSYYCNSGYSCSSSSHLCTPLSCTEDGATCTTNSQCCSGTCCHCTTGNKCLMEGTTCNVTCNLQ